MAYDSYTKLLSHFNGSNGQTTYTAETGQTITFVGTAQLSTAQKKFGSTSLLLDGNSDYVTALDSADWNFGSGNFTIDFWLYRNDSSDMGFYTQRVDTDNYVRFFYFDATPYIGFYIRSAAADVLYAYKNSATISTGAWHHIALVRNGTGANCIKIYIDGTTVGDLTLGAGAWNGAVPDLAATAVMGADTENLYYTNGYIDEFCISKGVARWTTDFTPPTSEYGLNTRSYSIII
jgi:hypothetical protein